MSWQKRIKTFLQTASPRPLMNQRETKLRQCKGKYKLRRGQKSKIILTGKHSYAPIVQQLLKIKWWDRSDEAINQIVPLLQKPLTQRTLKEIIDTLNSI